MAKLEHDIIGTLVEQDGTFLIVQESKPGREGLYNLPGGHVEISETLAEAAVREVEEESGYQVELTGFLGIYQTVFIGEQLNFSGPGFLARVTGGRARVSAEHPEVRWVTAEEFLALYDAGKFWTKYPKQLMQDYLRRGAYPMDTIFSARY